MPDDGDATGTLLRLVEADAEGRLRLAPGPAGRLVLPGLRLGRAALQARTAHPAWWQEGAASLRAAEFGGAELPDADLAGADLTGAGMQDVVARAATLREARLEGARLEGADMSGADLSGAQASEADFSRGLLEDARFGGAVLRFAKFHDALLDGADFTEADLWGARLDGAEAQEAVFDRAALQEASLAGADLSGARFGGAELRKADLRGVKLQGADLRGAVLTRANLAGADLSGASLPHVDLSGCELAGVRLAGAWLENTRLSVSQIAGGLGEDLAGEFEPARRGYLALERNFRGLGDPEAGRWCYLRARRMGKRGARQALVAALRGRDWRTALGRFGAWFGDAFAEWLCDYGESLPRVVRAFATATLCFTVFYGLSGTLVHTAEAGPGLAGTPVRGVLELLGFSVLNMVSSGLPDLGLKPGSHAIYFVSSLQYVLGVVLIGLFGYVLGNRIRR